MNYLTTGNNAVDSIGRMNISGNVIPQIWYKTIRNENGKPHYLAISILADIVYWYRPSEIRDERSGQIIGWKKKFTEEFLQRSYQSIAAMYGESEKTIIRALGVLENLHVIKKHRKTITLESGMKIPNVLYLELIPEMLQELTFPSTEQIDEIYKNEEKCLGSWTNLSDTPDNSKKIFSDISGEKSGEIVKKGDEMHQNTIFSSKNVPESQENVWEGGQICPSGRTDLSRQSDRFVQADGQICPGSRTDLSKQSDRFDQTNTENTSEINTENSTYNNIYSVCRDENHIYQSSIISNSGSTGSDKGMDGDRWIRIIRTNINYDFLVGKYNGIESEMYEEMYQLICDIVCVSRETVRINGTPYPYHLVRERFLKLTDEHLRYVYECMSKTYGKIRNIKAYMLSALYNAPDTLVSYYSNLANHDMYGGAAFDTV